MKVPIKLNERAKAKLALVAEWLEEGAPHVNVNGVDVDDFDMGVGIAHGECGTVCCIAGALVQFNAPVTASDTWGWAEEEWLGVSSKALAVLGKSRHSNGTAELFMDDYANWSSTTGHDEITPAIAARCIRHAIEHGVVDWERAMEELA